MFLFDHESLEPLSKWVFQIGDFGIRWYAVCIMVGALISFFVGLKWAKRLGIDEDIIYTGFAWGLVLGVLGARIYYCIFYDFHKFITQPWTVITEFMNGGLAIHGGIIAAAIFVFFYCKKIKIHPLAIGELVFPCFMIGQACGRWGNFFNKEAHGGLVPGATLDAQREYLSKFLPKFIVNQMYITPYTGDAEVAGYYQPTFLYESIGNLIGLGVILLLRKLWKKYKLGDGAFIYMIWYGALRFWIESMRTDPLMIGSLKSAQLISILFVVVGAALLILRHVFDYYPIDWAAPSGVVGTWNVKKDSKKEENSEVVEEENKEDK